ncbi:MAG: TIGR01459 family HAD-type hydrolase [Lactobacillaceae bacterium]|jgi:HAD superfamily hydrolase (TIGR01459 family)|nr:TIGR01459 family HAD-type hydrolase [Lactobacillaceae bacterium]
MIHNNLLEIKDDFDVFLFDAYGVFNFGKDVSPTAIDVMKQLMSMGKKVSIVSNATGTSEQAEASYAKKGLVKGEHYIELLTSGQYAYEDIQKGNLKVPGNKIYVAWTANFKKPEDKVPVLFKNSSYEIVENIADADFAYVGIPQINYEDRLEIDDFLPELKKIKDFGLVMVCANPDMKALEEKGFVVRQGLVSAEYEKMGGKVVYYGKPAPGIFYRALETFGAPDKDRVLMIGDTDRTDIKGANLAGIKSCLVLDKGVTGDALAKENIKFNPKDINGYLARKGIKADYLMEKITALPLFSNIENNISQHISSLRDNKR